MTDKEIFEKIISSNIEENLKITSLPLTLDNGIEGQRVTLYNDNDGDTGTVTFIRNSDDANLTSLESFATYNDIDDEDMERFNSTYGVKYSDKESLEDISFQVTYTIDEYDEREVKQFIGKPDALRALRFPDDYVITGYEMICNNKAIAFHFNQMPRSIYTETFPQQSHNGYDCKTISSISKKFGPNEAKYYLNHREKYEIYTEDEIRELDGCKDGDFETIADQLYGDYGMFDGYETFNQNDTNYVLVTKKAK